MAPISFDDCLTKYLGEFGRHQKKVCLLSCLFSISNALFIMMMVFTGRDPVKERWFACNDPNDADCARVYAMDPPTVNEICGLDSGTWHWTKPSRTIVSQFNLVCGRAILSQLVNSGFFLGYLLGSGIFGPMADDKGRKMTLLIAHTSATLFSIMSALAPNYWVFFVSRLLTGIGAAGQALVLYLLATESIGPKWRGAAGVATQMFFVIGEFVVLLVGVVFIDSWRGMCWTAVVVGFLSLGLLVPIPESPRWLLVKGRVEAAHLVLEHMAEENGTRMPLEPIASGAGGDSGAGGASGASKSAGDAGGSSSGGPLGTVDESRPASSSPMLEAGGVGSSGAGEARQGAAPEKPLNLRAVLKNRAMARRFFILAYVFMVLCMSYYGISLGLNGLKGSIYVTFLITTCAEIPANFLAAILIERIGRHNSLASGILIGGAACLACSFLPPGMPQAVMTAVGKFGSAGAFTIASIYTSELFPTLVRSAVLGVVNQAARVGAISAPFIVLLGMQLDAPAMPFLIFGCLAVVGGLLIFTLPETLGAPMPDSMKDMDNIASIFTTGEWRGGWRATAGALFSRHAYSVLRQRALTAAHHAAGFSPLAPGRTHPAHPRTPARPPLRDTASPVVPASPTLRARHPPPASPARAVALEMGHMVEAVAARATALMHTAPSPLSRRQHGPDAPVAAEPAQPHLADTARLLPSDLPLSSGARVTQPHGGASPQLPTSTRDAGAPSPTPHPTPQHRAAAL